MDKPQTIHFQRVPLAASVPFSSVSQATPLASHEFPIGATPPPQSASRLATALQKPTVVVCERGCLRSLISGVLSRSAR